MNQFLEAIEEYVSADLMSLLESYFFIAALVCVLVGGLVALYSYKVFRIVLVLVGSLVFGAVGGIFLGPWLEEVLTFIPETINFSAILGFLLAILGGFIMHFFLKFALFVTGAAIGWFGMYVFGLPFLTLQFPDVEFFSSDAGKILLPILAAIILGVLFIFLFKFLFIVITAFGGMTFSAFFAVIAVMPSFDTIALIVLLAIGVVAGICATVFQYKSNSKYKYYIMK